MPLGLDYCCVKTFEQSLNNWTIKPHMEFDCIQFYTKILLIDFIDTSFNYSKSKVSRLKWFIFIYWTPPAKNPGKDQLVKTHFVLDGYLFCSSVSLDKDKAIFPGWSAGVKLTFLKIK